jgi:uncharacterized LabA/DUF88 family protein
MPEKSLHLFVDNSNVLIEARRFSQKQRSGTGKLSPATDNSYEIDWGKFVHLVKSRGDRLLAQVPVLYGSRPPPDDTVWQQIRNEGFDVKVFDRNIRDKEKGVDMEMGMDIVERILTVTPPKTIAIAGGDADFVPVVRRARDRGWNVEVWFWSNASSDIKAAATVFHSLDAHLAYLRMGSGVALP